MVHPLAIIYFYIPHKRRKPGGHISTQSAIPHPWHPFNGVVLNRTARARKNDVVTVRLVSITLTILFAQCIFFGPPWVGWNHWTLSYSFCKLIHHICFWSITLVVHRYYCEQLRHTMCVFPHSVSFHTIQTCFNSCNVISGLCIAWSLNLSIRFVLPFLGLMRLLLTLPPNGSRRPE